MRAPLRRPPVCKDEMPATRVRKPRGAVGVALRDGLATPGLPHVHAATAAWEITSATSVEGLLQVDAVLDRALPGRLGCYVYPADAVLRCKDARGRLLPTTTPEDVAALLHAERVHEDEAGLVRHHLSVAAPVHAEEDEEDDADEDELVSCSEAEGEEEEEVPAEPECDADARDAWEESDADEDE